MATTKHTRRNNLMTLPPVYALEMLNEHGEIETVLQIVQQMHADGTNQRLIDRWVQGLEMSMRIRAGKSDLYVSAS